MKRPKIINDGVGHHRVYKDSGAFVWTMAPVSEKEKVDKYLVSINHPSAMEPGTAEQRFKSFVRELAKDKNPVKRKAKKKTTRKRNASGRFTKKQLATMRKSFSKIGTVDPSEPTYGKVTRYLDGLSQPLLKQLAGARIKFLSGLARNRVKSVKR